jgi:glyoxylase-like metal-dependent hydrolase (beta-lactamase superfamily II)
MQEVAEGIFVETAYEGVNVGAVVTSRGVIGIDVPTYPRDARHWAARLRHLSYDPLLYVILTDHHGDRILNSRWLNAPIIAHERAAERVAGYEKRYPQALIDSVTSRNPEQGKEVVNSPVDRVTLSFSEEMTLVFDDRRLCLTWRPGPTGSSVWVHVADEGILFAGDCLVVDTHPLLAEAHCERWLGHLATLQQANGEFRAVVPGRGPLNRREAIEDVATYLRLVLEIAASHHRQSRQREDMSDYVGQLLPRFALNGLPREWVARQIRLGLDRVYEDLQATA